jgi:hypothetical protein
MMLAGNLALLARDTERLGPLVAGTSPESTR